MGKLKHTIAQMIKPNKFKLIIFALFVDIIMLFPLYPSTSGFRVPVPETDENINDYKFSLIQVLYNDFQIVLILENDAGDESYYTYNFDQAWMLNYAIFFLIAYFLACPIGEFLTWKNKHIWKIGIKDL